MSDLLAIVPTRGRPEAARELIEAFTDTCTAGTRLLLVVDLGDPALDDYTAVVKEQDDYTSLMINTRTPTMTGALNHAADLVLQGQDPPRALAFMGDDHRPRTRGWDSVYLAALDHAPGMVFGDDLLQGPALPTQIAISSPIVAALGHMAPQALTHLYVDNYWRDLGTAAGLLTYLPEVVVEHLHPIAGKAPWTEGHRRVNTREMYHLDREIYRCYRESGQLEADVETVRRVTSRSHLQALARGESA